MNDLQKRAKLIMRLALETIDPEGENPAEAAAARAKLIEMGYDPSQVLASMREGVEDFINQNPEKKA